MCYPHKWVAYNRSFAKVTAYETHTTDNTHGSVVTKYALINFPNYPSFPQRQRVMTRAVQWLATVYMPYPYMWRLVYFVGKQLLWATTVLVKYIPFAMISTLH